MDVAVRWGGTGCAWLAGNGCGHCFRGGRRHGGALVLGMGMGVRHGDGALDDIPCNVIQRAFGQLNESRALELGVHGIESGF